jgi:DNA polymerase-3 subunit gamma/tau
MKYSGTGEFKNSYRPRNIACVVGHNSIKKFLKKSVADGTLPQVMLFYGQRGTGKTTIARIIAAGLNCEEGVSLSPCGVCDNCRSIFTDSGIGNVRDILETFKFSPMYLNNKVYIFDESHKMSAAAQNGLLKSLEDTPSNIYIIFCTTDKEPLLPTLLDRCYDFCFKGLNEKELLSMIEDIVVTEGKLLNGDIVKCLIDTSEGSARRLVVNLHKVLVSDARTIEEASEVLGTEIMQQQDMKHLSKAVLAADNKTALKIIDKYSYSDCDIARKSLINYFGAMLSRIGASKSINKANKISNIIDILALNMTNPSKGLFVNDIFKITTF